MKKPSKPKNDHKDSKSSTPPVIKLPKITLRLSQKNLLKAKVQANIQKMSNAKLNTKSIYDISRGKNTLDYEFEDQIRRQRKEIQRRKLFGSKNKENQEKSQNKKINNVKGKQLKNIKRIIHQKEVNEKAGNQHNDSLFNRIQNFLMDPQHAQKNYSSDKIKKKIKEKIQQYKIKYNQSPLKKSTKTQIMQNQWRKAAIKDNSLSIESSDFTHEAERVARLAERNQNSLKNYVDVEFEKMDLSLAKLQISKKNL